MSEQKKYMSVTRLGHKSTEGVLRLGDTIIVQEKLDGANASFMREGDVIRAFSRYSELDVSNTLGGFFQFAMSLDVEKLLEGVIYFGEWLNPHKIKYPYFEKQFFLFDIYNTHLEEYVNFSMVIQEANRLGLNIIPIFYMGEYQGYKHLASFNGTTLLGGKLGDKATGEGIVVKNVRYRDRGGNQVFVKLVVEEFAEVQNQKLPRDPDAQPPEAIFLSQFVTHARVVKILLKMIDEQVLDPAFGIEDMGTILKSMGTRVLEDIIKEESDSFNGEFDQKVAMKYLGRSIPPIVREIIKEREEGWLN